MDELSRIEEQSLCAMYRDGVSLRTLEVGFGLTTGQVVDVLERGGAVRRYPGETHEQMVSRLRQDVKHAA